MNHDSAWTDSFRFMQQDTGQMDATQNCAVPKSRAPTFFFSASFSWCNCAQETPGSLATAVNGAGFKEHSFTGIGELCCRHQVR